MNMIKIKTADLIRAQLDWAVARADGMPKGLVTFRRDGSFWTPEHSYGYNPSTDWAQGGKIIERETGREVAELFLHGGHWHAVTARGPMPVSELLKSGYVRVGRE